MNHNKEAKSLTFRRGAEVSQDYVTGLALHGTRRVDGDLLLQMLFHSTADSHIDAARIRYVGRALTATMDEYLQKHRCVATTC